MIAENGLGSRQMIPEPATIAAVGDIFPADHYFSLGHGLMSRTEKGALDDLFVNPRGLLRQADIALCNLEGPLSRRSDCRSSAQAAAFRGVPDFARLLKEAGFTHVNVANNHVSQHGHAALEDTLRTLSDHDLHIVGLRGQQPGEVCLPTVTHIRGRRLCVVGYSAVPERYSPDAPGYAHISNVRPAAEQVASLSREHDEVIVSLHVGEEGMPVPSSVTKAMCRQLIEAGARCVLGHHPHVFQPVERYRDGVIAYSLGNFAFDLFWDVDTERSAILLLRFDSGSLQYDLIPTFFSTDYRVDMQPAEQARRFLDELDQALATPMTDDQYSRVAVMRERRNRHSKLVYFLRNFARGSTRRKLEFLLSKLRPVWPRAVGK